MKMAHKSRVNQLKRWREAAVSFVKVAEMKPNGDYARDAAHGAVIAFKKLLDLNRTKSGKKSSVTGERYLPSAAIKTLSSAEYAATTAAKRRDKKRGKQFSKQPKKIAAKTRRFR